MPYKTYNQNGAEFTFELGQGGGIYVHGGSLDVWAGRITYNLAQGEIWGGLGYARGGGVCRARRAFHKHATS